MVGFGKYMLENQHSNFIGRYLQYATLKEIIYECQRQMDSPQGVTDTKGRFFALIQDQINDINGLVMNGVRLLDESAHTLLSSTAAFDNFEQSFLILDEYLRVNAIGIRKICKKFKKVTGQQLMLLTPLVRSHEVFGGLVCQLSARRVHVQAVHGRGAGARARHHCQ